MFKIKPEKVKYIDCSQIDLHYTEKMNKEYDWIAKGYDTFMILFPLWKKWIKKVIPYIEGKKILEVSFGNGYLMTQYVKDGLEIHGIDYNEKMLEIASRKILKKGMNVKLSKGNVEALPYEDNTFDTLINTMSFTGYPNGEKALTEMKRVLKKEGKLLIVDFDYPKDRNIIGFLIVKLMEKLGDIIKDINTLLKNNGFEYKDIPIGGYRSVHLFIAKKKQ